MEKNITGMMVYYYQVCKRKLWYFYHEIQMEQENENVIIGKVLDEESYQRDNQVRLDVLDASGLPATLAQCL